MHLPTDLIITLTTTYLLLLPPLSLLTLRHLSLRRARTPPPRLLSPRGVGAALTYAACTLTVAYAITGTWWWVTAELSTHHLDQGGGTLPLPREILRVGGRAELALTGVYVLAMGSVKGVFLALVREGWGGLGRGVRGVWWVAVGGVGAGVLAAVGVGGGTYTAIPRNLGAGIFPVVAAVIQIVTLSLVLLTSLLALRPLGPSFPPSIPPRNTTLLFAAALLSLFFTLLRLAALLSPSPRHTFQSILIIGELTLLSSAACLPALVVAKASSLHGHLLPTPDEPHSHSHSIYPPGRNRKNLTVSTAETRVTARDFGYQVGVDEVLAQGDHGAVRSAPLFVKPGKAQVKPDWDEKAAAGGGSSEEEDSSSSSDEEMGRGRWRGKVSGRISGLRSGFEEGREWRRGGGDRVSTPVSARLKTPRTPRGFV